MLVVESGLNFSFQQLCQRVPWSRFTLGDWVSVLEC